MKLNNARPTGPRTAGAALYSDVARRPAPQLAVPIVQPPAHQLVPLRLGTPQCGPAQATPSEPVFGRPRPPRPLNPAKHLFNVLVEHLKTTRCTPLLAATSLGELAAEDKLYCEKLRHLNDAFKTLLDDTQNFTVRTERLPQDMASLLNAHLVHSRALLGNAALDLSNNPSYKTFSSKRQERRVPIQFKVPVGDHATWLPTCHEFLEKITALCPLPDITCQVAQFYLDLAELVDGRRQTCQQPFLQDMLAKVAMNWRDYGHSIAAS